MRGVRPLNGGQDVLGSGISGLRPERGRCLHIGEEDCDSALGKSASWAHIKTSVRSVIIRRSHTKRVCWSSAGGPRVR
jgi:hypothetical protein